MGNRPQQSPAPWPDVIVDSGTTQMAQTQVSNGSKYARYGHALGWAWIAFAVVALAAVSAAAIFETGAYRSAMDAARSVLNAVAVRPPAVASQQEGPMLIREGGRI